MKGLCLLKCCLGIVCLTGVLGTSWASISDYSYQGSFTIPSADGLRYDALPDGRLVALNGAELLVETGVGTRTFGSLGMLPGADLPSNEFGYGGAAFLSVSPDGTKLAVGNGGGASFGNYQVGVFPLGSLASGTWFSADNYDASWYDNTQLAVTAGALAATNVSLLDTTSPNPASPSVTPLVSNIGGASSGIAFDSAGNLYTGNGFQFSGPSGTGAIKAFAAAEVAAAIGGSVIDFENTGTLVADVLSASSLGFDSEGNLFAGGGDFFGGSGDIGYAGLIDSAAVADALAGNGAIDVLDPSELRRLDPEGSSSVSYDVMFSGTTGELYLRDGGTVYVYAVPEPASLLLLGLMLLTQVRRR